MVERFDGPPEMQPYVIGDYVRYSDYAELAAENERLKQEVENWKTSAAGWQKIANVDAKALSRTGAVKDTEAARDALRELSNVKMDLSLEDWCRISNTILSALEPAAPEGEQEAARIGDAVLAWMIKYDLLDGEQEYYVADVIAVLDDLGPATRPSEQAVTEAMVEAAWKAFKSLGVYASDKARLRTALKAAMETGG